MRSIGEILLAEQLRQAGIPFEAEYRFHPERRWKADFAIVGKFQFYVTHQIRHTGMARLLIEVDGGGYIRGRHSTGTGIEGDCEKQSAAAILGFRVLRVTPKQVDDGRALAWIRAALEAGS